MRGQKNTQAQPDRGLEAPRRLDHPAGSNRGISLHNSVFSDPRAGGGSGRRQGDLPAAAARSRHDDRRAWSIGCRCSSARSGTTRCRRRMSTCGHHSRRQRRRAGPRRRGASRGQAGCGGQVTWDVDRLPQADLAGVRLGVLERTLLMAAPPLGTLGGLLIAAPEGTRSAQQGYLRAARKLEHLLLLDCVRVRQAVRAHDPRRERPMYRRGRFWRREDRTRRQIVWRVVVWATPWGEGIRLAYGENSAADCRFGGRRRRTGARTVMRQHTDGTPMSRRPPSPSFAGASLSRSTTPRSASSRRCRRMCGHRRIASAGSSRSRSQEAHTRSLAPRRYGRPRAASTARDAR